jgi:hypothetical protein
MRREPCVAGVVLLDLLLVLGVVNFCTAILAQAKGGDGT